MYIAFDLPTKSKEAYTWAWMMLGAELDTWSKKYNIIYQTKTVKYVKRVVLEPDDMYSFFALTWNPTVKTVDYRIIEPMSLDNH
jgi:hypothetical protein